jgi:hypothetical protein
MQARDVNGVIDLSALGVTIAYFRMARISTASVVVSMPATITDAGGGEAEYRWAVADTSELGEFAVSFLFTSAAGDFSLPRSEMAKVVVEDQFVVGT